MNKKIVATTLLGAALTVGSLNVISAAAINIPDNTFKSVPTVMNELKTGTAKWDNKNKSLTLLVGGITVVLKLNNGKAMVNGKNVKLEKAPMIGEDNRFYIPASFVQDTLEKLVAVNPETVASNADKAIAVIKSLESGDPSAIKAYINPDKYNQHNLSFPNGRDVMLGALDQLKAAGTTVNIKRVIVDGDYVAIHTDYNFGGPKAGFDIFRFEDGKIVEHWDNLQLKADPNPSGHTMLDGTTAISDLDKTAANKTFVEQFVKDILVGEHPEKLNSYFNGDSYIQHNPSIADGVSGLGKALSDMSAQGITMIYDKIHKVIGQGNMVLVVSEGEFGGKPTSYYDLFRVENGKIAEHWDVLETIPPQSEWANSNSKF
ncbi:nuclear transport factor 2 family protein [Paenibacillus kribbensis]|uniref:nuclear transport factor 2 family protein n=1 Tax=Paenibacillus kribbensis TaxID=172713 RepID=UPI000AB03AFF|nr:nuclear transport factor 2 family protein [Paenibacillus kribbensis]